MSAKKIMAALLSLTIVMGGPFSSYGQPSPLGVRVVVGELAEGNLKSILGRALERHKGFQNVEDGAVDQFRKDMFRSEGAVTPSEDLRIAREALSKGKKAYEELAFKEAADLLEEARREFIVKLPILRSSRELSDVHLFLGMALVAQKEYSRARDIFRRLVYLDPKRELTLRNYPPEVVEQFSKVRQEVLAADSIKVHVDSSIPKATVYLNGKSIGITPMDFRLAPGEYFLLVEKKGLEPWFGPMMWERRVESVYAKLKNSPADRRWTELFRIREGVAQQDQDVHMLQDLGKSTRADLILLTEIQKEKNFRWFGQWYEVKTGEFSKVAVLTMGDSLQNVEPYAQDLADALNEFLNSKGQLISPKLLDIPTEQLTVGGANAPKVEMNEAPSEPKKWYEQWWIYPLIGGAAVGIFFGARELGGAGTKIVVNNQ